MIACTEPLFKYCLLRYPFETAVASLGSSLSACIENIDIRGPCMVSYLGRATQALNVHYILAISLCNRFELLPKTLMAFASSPVLPITTN